jgi:cyclic beta-1,2-glucan synthetase
MLNPINHSNTRLGAHKYKLEPYVMAGDVYSEARHTGAVTGAGTLAQRLGCIELVSHGFLVLQLKIIF